MRTTAKDTSCSAMREKDVTHSTTYVKYISLSTYTACTLQLSATLSRKLNPWRNNCHCSYFFYNSATTKRRGNCHLSMIASIMLDCLNPRTIFWQKARHYKKEWFRIGLICKQQCEGRNRRSWWWKEKLRPPNHINLIEMTSFILPPIVSLRKLTR